MMMIASRRFFSSSNITNVVEFTSRGAARIAVLQKQRSNPNLKLRLWVDGGGCSGFQYNFEVTDSDAKEDDIVFECEGKHLLIDKDSLEFVKGSKVDFTEDLIRRSFEVVDNPNAESGCGCGSSFSMKNA